MGVVEVAVGYRWPWPMASCVCSGRGMSLSAASRWQFNEVEAASLPICSRWQVRKPFTRGRNDRVTAPASSISQTTTTNAARMRKQTIEKSGMRRSEKRNGAGQKDASPAAGDIVHFWSSEVRTQPCPPPSSPHGRIVQKRAKTTRAKDVLFPSPLHPTRFITFRTPQGVLGPPGLISRRYKGALLLSKKLHVRSKVVSWVMSRPGSSSRCPQRRPPERLECTLRKKMD